MSLGFSVGDFISAASLISSIVASLRYASTSPYNEIVSELHGLQHALNEIEQLKCAPDQQAGLNSVKVAALTCQHPLEEFNSKLRKYQSFARHNVDTQTVRTS